MGGLEGLHGADSIPKVSCSTHHLGAWGIDRVAESIAVVTDAEIGGIDA